MCGHDDLSQFIEKSNPKNGKNPGNFARKSFLCQIIPEFKGFLARDAGNQWEIRGWRWIQDRLEMSCLFNWYWHYIVDIYVIWHWICG
jgi:hypothetical protein